ncbi:MAG TPA: ABC transporter ATP-binding protein [Methanocella sp.]|nr:ABC transporter ATP-binding protein [Methanocella sp.]
MYDNVHGIHGIDFEIGDGVSLGLLGRNGAGKTTLVRALIGLIKPDSGSAVINGFNVITRPDSVRKVVGYLPEVFGLYNDMTVYDILDYTGRLYCMRKTDRSDSIEYLLDRLELSDIRNMKAGALSKGLRQKVGFARALVNDPQVVFLDEPTSGLDPIASRGIENLIAELKNDGKTFLITSHILPEAEKMCDYVALIKGGGLIASGRISDIKKKYSEPTVIIRLQDEASAGLAAKLLKTMLPGVETSESTVTVLGAGLDKTMLTVNKKLVEANIPVLEIHRQEASLDDVYFRVMEA